jgi:glycosyltransferase involved in cell wall biosynthesis
MPQMCGNRPPTSRHMPNLAEVAPAPRFSFVVPALNEENCIANCIRSIQSQTEPPFEVIVVDNGSTDRTNEIARQLGCVVVFEEKLGLSHARNKGAEVAGGDIVCFIDADGVIASNWLRSAKQCFSDPRIGAVSGLSIYMHRSLVKRMWYNTYVLVSSGSALLSNFSFSRMIFGGNNLAIRREIFWQIGGYEPIVAEGLWLSRRFWSLSSYRGKLCFGMLMWNSPRRFEHRGFLRTMLYWMRAALFRLSQEGYTYKSP